MGKPTGFLDHERKTATREAVDKRLKHYREMYRWLGEDELKQQAARCMNCGVPFCHGSGCPLGNSIPEFNDLVYKGHWQEASERLHLTSNFPEITGRVCPALCETSCVVGINDEPVAIREIELAIVEKAWQEQWITPQPPAVETDKAVAIVGSGPAGLSAAQQLRRAGHAVTVYEKADRLGGLLRYGIPDFKLEKWLLDRRLKQYESEGVEFETGIEVGRDISASYLRKKFDAVVLAGGAMKPRDLPIPGREADGIHFAMDFLRQQNQRNAGDVIPEDEAILANGKRVIVIGGGDTGSDCVGTSLRQGAKSVEQFELMPLPPEERDDESTPWPMWPYLLRTSSSHEEGGERRWSVATDEFLVKDGVVTGLRGHEVRWARDDATGRMSMEAVPDTEFTLEADLIILAMGFTQPVHEGLLDDLGVACDKRGNVQINAETMMTSVEGVFSAGDMQSGAWLVVGAMVAGRRVARRVDQYLMGETELPDMEMPAKLFVYDPGA